MEQANQRASARLKTMTSERMLCRGIHLKAAPRIIRPGLEVTEIAARSHIARTTLCALLVHHGYLELAPYDGTQQRHLLTQKAIANELGVNVCPLVGGRRGKRHAQTAPFPLFFADEIEAILWTLDYQRLLASMSLLNNKRRRADWLMAHWAFLPRQELARLSGYTEWGWAKLIQSCSASHNTGGEMTAPADGYLMTWLKTTELLRKS